MTITPDSDRDRRRLLIDDPQHLKQTLDDLFKVAAMGSSRCRTCQMLSNSAKVLAHLQHVLREGE